MPSIGRVVHFVMPDGQHRPAFVVRVWDHELVNLQVFTDGYNDSPPSGVNIAWETSVPHVEEAAGTDDRTFFRTWHWPEVCK